MQKASQACMLAALICQDCSVDKSADNLVAAAKAGGVTVPSSTAKVFETLLAKTDLDSLLGNLSVGGGGAPAAAGAAAPAAAEEKPAAAPAAEPSEEDEDMGFGLFD